MNEPLLERAEVNVNELELWSVSAAADYLHCKVSTVRTYIRNGELRTIWIGGRYLILNSSLNAFIDARRDMAAPCGRKPLQVPGSDLDK